MSITGILSFILVLGALIFVHELGHFLLARLVKVKVLKFALGFGPKIFGIKRGDTEYLIAAVPLGGYVKLFGDDPQEELPEEQKADAFTAQPTWKKAAIVAAGPIFNLVFAYIIFTFVYIFAGLPQLLPHVGKVSPDSPALAANMQEGDVIISIAGKQITYWDDIREVIQKNKDNKTSIEVKRGDENLSLKITPNLQTATNIFNEPVKLWMIGIQPTGETYIEDISVIRAVGLGYKKTVEIIYLTLTGITKMITGSIPANNIGGPILIAQMTAQTAEQGILSVILFTALLSVNLGLLNLLPIPILDGGHLLFFAIESALRRQINERYKEIAQQVGLVLLISLMIFAFYNDFTR